MTSVLPWVVCFLTGTAIGIIIGRVSGLAEGERTGKALAPLELRADALLQGVCPICEQPLASEEQPERENKAKLGAH